MSEPWNTIIALIVGLPLCAVALGGLLLLGAAAFADWASDFLGREDFDA
jgi:hypothetical protein